ncbi:MAG: flagellar type III secretion system pore protein FliP [Planctomycetaceae bacterium]|nr:flagellar type III secretion system pore protein FliP [Planctomycetaceae bacterium]
MSRHPHNLPRRLPGTLAAAALLAVLAEAALAQPVAPAPPALPAARPAASQPAAVPSMGNVMSLVDKATSAQGGKGDWSSPVKLAVVFTGMALLPSMLVMMTAFSRIVIVLAFIRRALTTQSIPPTIAIIGLALFLTLFTMAPVMGRMNEKAIQPYLADKINFEAAATAANAELKDFMLRQTRKSDLELFVNMSNIPQPRTAEDVPTYVAIPSFAISEFRTAFEMGALLFVPFLLIDLVISGILLSAGMMMLPPAMISLPFKIVLFVLVDGWRVLAQTLVSSFN